MANPVSVYRFKREVSGRELCPTHMWGTLEAIAWLPGCTPMLESAREVDAALLEDGFLFEAVSARAIQIDTP